MLGRADLMAFLRQECQERGATIIYVSEPWCSRGSMRVLGMVPLTFAPQNRWCKQQRGVRQGIVGGIAPSPN